MTSLLCSGLCCYGTLRGAYATYGALRADDPSPSLLMFWATLAVYRAAEPWADAVLGTVLPLYSVWKLVLLIVWLSLPPEATGVRVFRALAPYEHRVARAVRRARGWAAGTALRASLAVAGAASSACLSVCADEDLARAEQHASTLGAAVKTEKTRRLRLSFELASSAKAPAQAAPAPAPAAEPAPAVDAGKKLKISRKSRRRTAFVPARELEDSDDELGGENAPRRSNRTAVASKTPKKVSFGLH